tara:strand:+ start:4971 stop:5720 length:750 start_codon:yes stop_codon:yes gene_type:complete
MNNHTHVVLRINKEKAEALSTQEVIGRWLKLYKGMLLCQRYIQPDECTTMSDAEVETVKSLAEVYRYRLYDISWFMRLLNEFIARRANKEDECTGHFWEGRFKSQALLDEASLAACMAYVDLNPVRARIAKTPESSVHTSIKMRIQAARSSRQPRSLLPFAGNPSNNMPDGIPFHLEDYLKIIEFTGRHYHPDKPGKINDAEAPILSRVGLDNADWNAMVAGIETEFKTAVSIEKLSKIKKPIKRTLSA